MKVENATPVDLLATIKQACNPLKDMPQLKTSDEQIDYLLGNGWHSQLQPFEQWRQEQVKSVLTVFEKKGSKNFAKAKEYKQMADMYSSMVESEFTNKAFQSLSKVRSQAKRVDSFQFNQAFLFFQSRPSFGPLLLRNNFSPSVCLLVPIYIDDTQRTLMPHWQTQKELFSLQRTLCWQFAPRLPF